MPQGTPPPDCLSHRQPLGALLTANSGPRALPARRAGVRGDGRPLLLNGAGAAREAH